LDDQFDSKLEDKKARHEEELEKKEAEAAAAEERKVKEMNEKVEPEWLAEEEKAD